jgi:NTE family protein
MMQPYKLGLALTGGGAKGAYQAGALAYLAEIDLKPQIIAGTSIGALNGAIIAANDNFKAGVERLNELWAELGDTPILKFNPETIVEIAELAHHAFVPTIYHCLKAYSASNKVLGDGFAFLDPTPIEKLLKKSLDVEALRQGTELWVTAFPSLNLPLINYNLILNFVRAKIGQDVHWFCVQDYPDTEAIYNILLASAALPMIFPSRSVDGKQYVDGGLAAHVPIQGLIDQGCTHIVIIHLRNGDIWNRHNYPNQTILEIRPQQIINKSNSALFGSVQTFTDFSLARITDLRQRGYQDAKRCLEAVMHTFQGVNAQRKASDSLSQSTRRLLDDLPL